MYLKCINFRLAATCTLVCHELSSLTLAANAETYVPRAEVIHPLASTTDWPEPSLIQTAYTSLQFSSTNKSCPRKAHGLNIMYGIAAAALA